MRRQPLRLGTLVPKFMTADVALVDIEFHPVANIFPLMEGEDYEALKSDIAAHGLHEPIWLHPDGRIIDGRNRYRACRDLGLEPIFRIWDDNQTSLVAFVVSLNLHRRHLSSSQRAVVALDILPMLEAEARERMAAGAIAVNTGKEIFPYPNGNMGQARDQAAAIVGTNGHYVSQAKRIAQQAPLVLDRVRNGTLPLSVASSLAQQAPDFQEAVIRHVDEGMKPADAFREARKKAVVEKLEDIQTVEAKALVGQYDVIVVDPPWPMAKIERDERPNQTEFDYPTMTEDELRALAVPCADNCHVWLWTTQKFLPLAFDLLDAWKLKYVCTFVWHKPGGFQPYGLPQYNCEFALYARRGAPLFVDTKAFSTCFEAPRGRHSEKPEVFYDLVRRVTAGRRLDMFGRRMIDGFDSWGKEAPDACVPG